VSNWLDDFFKVPGPAGATGAAGAATTLLGANFTQPVQGQDVTITVGSSLWMQAGMPLSILGGGIYNVVALGSPVSATIQNMNGVNNAAPGATVTSGALVTTGTQPIRWVPPDSNDVFVWLLQDASTTTFNNIGSAGTSSATAMTSLSGGTLLTAPGPFGTCPGNQAAGTQYNQAGSGTLVGATGAQSSIDYPITVSAWFYLLYINGTYAYICTKSEDPSTGALNHCSYALAISQGNETMHVRLRIGGADVAVNATFPQFYMPYVNSNKWHHAGFTYDGATLNMYMDGQLVSSTAQTGHLQFTDANPVCCFNAKAATENYSYGYDYNGRVADVRIATTIRNLAWFESVWNLGAGYF
jgi:hypothetical protein